MAGPAYADLPLIDGTDIRHSWDVWPDRQLGALNRISPVTRKDALAEVHLGVVINLNLPLDEPRPRLFGRPELVHRVFPRSRSMIEDHLDNLDPQASSQWDSLRHFAAGRAGFYGGVTEWESADSESMGIHRWLDVGIVLRAVMVDLPRLWQESGSGIDPFDERAITVDELADSCRREGVTFGAADLLLVRTGWLRRFKSAEVSEGQASSPVGVGLHAGPEMAEFLWDHSIVAVASDNPAVEVIPGDPRVGSLHRRCLAGLGIPFGELWDLEGLAASCADRGRYSCCVISVPLNVKGGVGSPANAIALI